MKIGVIGAGKVGGNLGGGWAKKGHEVMYGVRDPNSEKTRKAVSASGDAKVGTLAEAAAFGEVVVLTVPWAAAHEIIPALGNLSGKIVIDTMNAFSPPADQRGRLPAGNVYLPGAKPGDARRSLAAFGPKSSGAHPLR